MRNTKQRPVSVGEMLKVDFLELMDISVKTPAESVGALLNGGVLAAPNAIKLAAPLGNTKPLLGRSQISVVMSQKLNANDIGQKNPSKDME